MVETRSPRMSASDRREQYLEVAARLAVEQGVDAVTMEAVAGGAGVNKALLYRQFANRGEILLALWERENARTDEAVESAKARVSTFDEKIRAWIHAWFSYVAENGPLMGRLIEARTIADEVRVRHLERQRGINAYYGEWYAGELGLPRDVAQDAAAMLFAALGGAIDTWVLSPVPVTRTRLERTYVDMVLGTLLRLQARYL